MPKLSGWSGSGFEIGTGEDPALFVEVLRRFKNFLRRKKTSGIELAEAVEGGKHPTFTLPTLYTAKEEQGLASGECKARFIEYEEVRSARMDYSRARVGAYADLEVIIGPRLEAKIRGEAGYEDTGDKLDFLLLLAVVERAMCGHESTRHPVLALEEAYKKQAVGYQHDGESLKDYAAQFRAQTKVIESVAAPSDANPGSSTRSLTERYRRK